jgi:flavin reductase
MTRTTSDPPQILVCVNRGATAQALLARSRRFVVNFLSEEHEDRARRFSQTKLAAQERFAGISWVVMTTGSPYRAGEFCRLMRQGES